MVNEVIDADGTVVVVVVVVDVVDVVDVDVVDVVELVVELVVDVEVVVDVDGTVVVVVELEVVLDVEVELVVPVGTVVVGTTVVSGGVVTPVETMVVGETVAPVSMGLEDTTVFGTGFSKTFQVCMTKPIEHFLLACTTARDFVLTQTFKDPLAEGTVTFLVPEGHFEIFEMTSFFETF